MYRHYKVPLLALFIQLGILLSLYVIAPAPAVTLVVTGVVLVAISAWQPASGIAAACALLPLYHEPVHLDFGTLPPSEIAVWTAAGGALIQIAGTSWANRDVNRLFESILQVLRSRLVQFTLAISLAGFLSLLANWESAAIGEGLREIRWTLVEPLVLVAVLVAVCRTYRDRNLVIAGYLGGALVFALIAAGDIFFGGGVQVGGVTRISGIYSHPNAMAMYSTRALVFGVALLILTRQFRRHWLGLAAVSTLLVILTFARNALLVIAATGIGMSWTISKRVRRLTVVSAVAAVGVLTAAAPGRMLDGLAGGSLDLRIDIWRAGISMIRDNPLVGIGPDQFFAQYAPRYVLPTGWAERFTAHAHNLIIDSWLRLGIIGAVFVAIALIACIHDLRRLTKGSAHFSPVQAAALLALIALLVQGMIDNAYFLHDLAMSTWLLAWLRHGAMSEFRKERKQSS